jgi:hypothetical protein
VRGARTFVSGRKFLSRNGNVVCQKCGGSADRASVDRRRRRTIAHEIMEAGPRLLLFKLSGKLSNLASANEYSGSVNTA